MGRIVVEVMPKPEILDPQGKAVVGSLPRLGFEQFTGVRQGRRFELTVDGPVTEEHLAAAREAGDLAAINLWEKNLAFNLGGHTNHSIFWKNLSPNGGGQPEGELAEAIKDSFGSFEKFQAQFTATAMGIQGSGWAVLAYDSLSGKLVTFQLFDQQGNVPVGTIPLFMVDMWEHAFYLDYLNVKADYVKAVWNIANWQDVSERLADAVAKAQGLIVR